MQEFEKCPRLFFAETALTSFLQIREPRHQRATPNAGLFCSQKIYFCYLIFLAFSLSNVSICHVSKLSGNADPFLPLFITKTL